MASRTVPMDAGSGRRAAGSGVACSPPAARCPLSDNARMPTLIEKPSVIAAAGNKPKIIEEFIGRVNSRTEALSVARMQSPSGWVEPGQAPEFDEYTVVLRGSLRVTTRDGVVDVNA